MTLPSREIWRKSVHFSGIFLLPLLLWNRAVFTGLLFIFLFFYVAVELASRSSKRIPFLSALTEKCKRPAEAGKFSKGALFLVFSGIVTPYLFGPSAAALGLAQAFVADTVSTFAGMEWGAAKLPYNKGKSWVGSSTFLITASLVGLFFTHWPQALLLGFIGAIVESLPIPEADNLLIPFAVGIVAAFIKFLG